MRLGVRLDFVQCSGGSPGWPIENRITLTTAISLHESFDGQPRTSASRRDEYHHMKGLVSMFCHAPWMKVHAFWVRNQPRKARACAADCWNDSAPSLCGIPA